MKTYFKRALVLLVAPLMAMLLSSCEKDLTILPVEPTIEQKVTASGTFAVCLAKVTCPGNITVEVEWSLTPDMGNAQRQTMESDGGTFFTATMRGLSKKTTYYYRVTMANRFQSVSSAVAQFTTVESDVPVVTTSAVENITHKNAICGGKTFNGGPDVTERGLCWSTSHNPTVNDSHASSGTGTGSFTLMMTGLKPNTTFYVRAYAVNDNGISYGNEVSFTTTDVPVYLEGAVDGVFSVGSNKKAYFSQGNLQYQASTGKWRFAEHQYDCIGSANGNISSSYSGWIDLFGWGTSGYNGKNPYMTSTNYSDYGNGSNDIAGTNYDWGVYNAISNGGNTANTWRTLTKDEWMYVFNTRTTSSGIRFAMACVNGVKGVILLPDDWSTGYYSLSNTNDTGVSFSSNTITSVQWATMEQNGAVFLPTAGFRKGSWVNVGSGEFGSSGYYWSASYRTQDLAYRVFFSELGLSLNPEGSEDRYRGLSVRLVRSAQ